MRRCTPLVRGLLGRSCSSVARPAATMFTEEEEMMRDAVARFAQDVVAPRVRSMDARAVMDTEVIEGMHANGLLGVEIEEQYGGGGFGFTAALIVVEELAKVDASVSVLCDIQVREPALLRPCRRNLQSSERSLTAHSAPSSLRRSRACRTR
jgi:alkylation response protein AidB-like acyl-CoA dehydrogenase